MKLKKLLTLGLLTLGLFSPFTKNLIKTKAASDSYVRQFIDYEPTEDLAYIYYMPGDRDYTYKKMGVIFTFDDYNGTIESINRLSFRIKYRKQTNFFHGVGNWWENLFGNPPKYGDLVTVEETVKASLDYSWEIKKGTQSQAGIPTLPAPVYNDPEKLTFPAIGKMADLFEAEEAARDLVGDSAFNSAWLKSIVTGGPYYMPTPKQRLNDSSFAYAYREWYAIIPISWTEEVGPESIDCYLFDGTHISDGLDENGDPFIDPETGSKYIDATTAKDFGVAINGQQAKVTKVEITGFAPGTDNFVVLNNANWNLAAKEPGTTLHSAQFGTNKTENLNWAISNNNRYIFITWSGDATTAKNIKIRIFYEGTSAWLINVTDKDGNFLPDPVTVQRTQPNSGGLVFKDLLIIIGIVILLIIILVILYDIFKALILGR